MELTISGHEDYYSPKFQSFLENEITLPTHQWIYKLISNDITNKNEIVYLQTADWLLCANRVVNEQQSFLIIFKDLQLKTLRDLRQQHIMMLQNAAKKVKNWLLTNRLYHYHFYFHYMPSTFQLHMHVNKNKSKCSMRQQPLHVVINNLISDTNYYKNALILTKYCKTVHRSITHSVCALNANILKGNSVQARSEIKYSDAANNAKKKSHAITTDENSHMMRPKLNPNAKTFEEMREQYWQKFSALQPVAKQFITTKKYQVAYKRDLKSTCTQRNVLSKYAKKLCKNMQHENKIKFFDE